MKIGKINLFLVPLLMLSSCNKVSSHDDFALKGIAFLKNGDTLTDASYVKVIGTYDFFDSNAHYDLDFQMKEYYGNRLYYSTENCPDYLKNLVNYLINNSILQNYIAYTTNSDMKKYYVSNDMIKVEDYSQFSTSDYTDSYTWDSYSSLVEMTHYFKDENSNQPIAKASVTFTKDK